MKLPHEFIRLPLEFDAQLLAQEVGAIDSALWRPHHEGFKGNYSIPLVSVNGEDNNDFKGPMAATDVLNASPYLKKVIASFGEVIGRSRLMALDPGAEVPVHSDINYHWYKRVRIHIPITTTPDVIFYCGDKSVNMRAGEAWIFDSWKYHRVVNASDIFRVHLVIDICGSSTFWEMAERGNVPWLPQRTPTDEFTFINNDTASAPTVLTEQYNTPLVMSPGEMEGMAQELFSELADASDNPKEEEAVFVNAVKGFCQDWRVLWSQYGLNEAGWPHYHALRQRAFESVKHFDSVLKLANGTQAPRMFLFCMIDPALNVEVKDSFLGHQPATTTPNTPQAPGRATSSDKRQQKTSVSGDITAPASRTAPCPCGSGKRYKNCHGRLV
ncbi:aspartyl/asparaginyl beta-hydroxylase domain-containing protein [Alteromonas antoniana]|uniref:aspartyl/asparaginyl beta-hydroxylase domain-containing protein n=1 Tax=Alteromonas antoniana TaxID=2803813 RepID=UPI001C472D06|nr:aspartyl/asparaginyl beta-hydroxylase domain-containing protein [Alteromonas antoniana]